MKEVQIQHKRIVTEKLIPFGFEREKLGYSYSETILGDEFRLRLFVDKDGHLYTQLTETAFDDEYVLHLIPDAQGVFVGKVRAAYNAVLERFTQSCCERDVFRSDQAHAVIEYVRKTYGSRPEYLWEKFPEDAVLRRDDSGSWYGVLLVLSLRKLGFDSDDKADIIDLRMRAEDAPKLIDGKRYLSGYHMNKKHWFTIVLDGSVPTEEIFAKIDESYSLAAKK